MEKDSILIYNLEKGFGEILWITCPVCWNSMKLVYWEDSSREEHCPACRSKEREISSP